MRKAPSFKLALAAVAVVGAVAVSACQSTPTRKENMMAAAGFQMRLADNPQKQAALAALPQRTFLPRTIKGRTAFMFADAKGCNCLYIGDQTAYQTYQGMAFDQRISSQNLVAAQMNADASWDYGMWGPGLWW